MAMIITIVSQIVPFLYAAKNPIGKPILIAISIAAHASLIVLGNL